LAIIALLSGKYYGWNWLDAVMGFVGAGVILVWAWGLIRETSPVLVDQSVDEHYKQAIQDTWKRTANARSAICISGDWVLPTMPPSW